MRPQRPESVLRPDAPPPFRHPYFATHRDEQADAFRDEVGAMILRDDAFRARLSRARILEAVH
ncbi:hypothetical protein [Pseudorhizobium banfieldiae]|uniref:hypothetical protein n=1 Tax=Pseudorhizobium banfieldiae TaxID=1125847 RepID=UPI000698D024|nr:hypothetical protein [Pseudorhizobium banfieldiae]CAD6606173.1 hypothetical protein RNT25_01803 [arsenite-oxidising bacterium NT-25]